MLWTIFAKNDFIIKRIVLIIINTIITKTKDILTENGEALIILNLECFNINEYLKTLNN